MGAMFAQDARMGRLATVLGKDVLVLQRFSGHDGLSASFVWQVDCLAVTPDIDFDAVIGTHATVTLVTRQGERHFDGIVTEAQWLGAGENGIRYRLVLKPWFHLARLRRNQRIFHNKTVVQILTDLLATYASAGKLQPRLTADYPVLEYTVQFRESDHDFACRLMERFGITYHFQHVAGDHTMVLTDAADSHVSIGARPFHPDDGHHQADSAHFWEWRPARRITTGAIRLTDYNFKTPTAAMEVDQTGDAAYAEGQIESFDWPGDYPDQGRGRVVARLRTHAERGQDRRYEAVGDVAELGAGGRVTLGGDAVPGTGDDYLCLSATHSYTSDSYGSGATEGDGYAYSGRYVLMPATAPMLPERKTPRADVKGPQTAVVVGEGEIDCDEYGRILVRFHWDLHAANSMRCRVSQNWAGNGWGGMVIPRIGMEVVVEFLDGDPDQPLVTGCVYNGRNKVPYELPKNKTRSTFKTNTHQGRGFNELRFEDEKDEEEIFIHAQKDMNTVVRRDHLTSVDRSLFLDVGGEKMERVTGNFVQETGGAIEFISGMGTIISAGGKSHSRTRHQQIPKGELQFFELAKGRLKAMDSAQRTGGLSITTATSLVEDIGTSHQTFVRFSSEEIVGAAKSVHAGKVLQLNSGGSILTAAADNTAIEAGSRIDIVCGDSAIRLNADGTIEIEGNLIRLQAGRIDLN